MTTEDGSRPETLPDEELATRLAAYAATLDAPPAALARIRRATLAVAAERSSRRRFTWVAAWAPLRRPLLAFAAAALLLVLAVGGTFAAAPGGPLYGARLWLETATLPTDPGARTDAEIGRLDDRLGEAEQAAADGNGAAVTAALDAYSQIVDAAAGAAGADPSRQQRLEAVLERHQAVLTALVASHADRGASAAAIQAALDRNSETIQRISGEVPSGSPSTSTPEASGKPIDGRGQGAGPGGAPGQSGAPGQAAGPGAGPGQGAGQGQGQGAGQGQGPGAGQGPKATPSAAGGTHGRPSPTPSHRPTVPEPSESPRH